MAREAQKAELMGESKALDDLVKSLSTTCTHEGHRRVPHKDAKVILKEASDVSKDLALFPALDPQQKVYAATGNAWALIAQRALPIQASHSEEDQLLLAESSLERARAFFEAIRNNRKPPGWNHSRAQVRLLIAYLTA
jgi:hypothetical protein